jgi:FXSXX-COOH protein
VGVVDRTTDDSSQEWRSPLVDVSDMSLSELADSVAATDRGADTALALTLRRLADELDEPGEPIAGFNSAL